MNKAQMIRLEQAVEANASRAEEYKHYMDIAVERAVDLRAKLAIEMTKVQQLNAIITQLNNEATKNQDEIKKLRAIKYQEVELAVDEEDTIDEVKD